MNQFIMKLIVSHEGKIYMKIKFSDMNTEIWLLYMNTLQKPLCEMNERIQRIPSSIFYCSNCVLLCHLYLMLTRMFLIDTHGQNKVLKLLSQINSNFISVVYCGVHWCIKSQNFSHQIYDFISARQILVVYDL